jgi:UPF0755 protein
LIYNTNITYSIFKFFHNKIVILILGILSVGVISVLLLSYFFFSAPDAKSTKIQTFTVSLKIAQPDIISRLYSQGLIKNITAFKIVSKLKGINTIQSGGYFLSKNINVWQLAQHLKSGPELKWVVIPEGLRKEEIGERLQKVLNWSQQDLDDWNNKFTALKYDDIEGVYFPDTYLIPINEKPADTAQRFINHFNEKFAPYFSQFSQKGIMWTTGLRFASIIQREAGSKVDMPLIAGILWNRLNQNIKLEIDATVQYARGKTDSGWWTPIKPSDKEINSPYNTYLNEGLPPHPICNPGLDAIDAVLNPETTDCLYYLHDSNRQIHCAKTLEEHQANIDKYLRSN